MRLTAALAVPVAMGLLGVCVLVYALWFHPR
jgi:hypothetical protein